MLLEIIIFFYCPTMQIWISRRYDSPHEGLQWLMQLFVFILLCYWTLVFPDLFNWIVCRLVSSITDAREGFTKVLKPQKWHKNSKRTDLYWVVLVAAVQISVLTCFSRHWNSSYMINLLLLLVVLLLLLFLGIMPHSNHVLVNDYLILSKYCDV